MSAKTIRYYEEIGLVPPSNREGVGWKSAGRRVYKDSNVERLRFVKEARQLDFSIEDIKQLLASYESGPACGCGARPFLKTLIERKLKEIGNALDSLEALRGELQALYARTLAVEGTIPAELIKVGQPTPSDAMFGGHNKRHGID